MYGAVTGVVALAGLGVYRYVRAQQQCRSENKAAQTIQNNFKKQKLFNACSQGDLKAVKEVIESGFLVNSRNRDGDNPLI